MPQIEIDKNYFRPSENVKSFENIADAKANTFLRIGDTVITTGYTTPSDGGGASYIVVAGGTGVDDGGSYHDMANGLQLELSITGRINALSYGVRKSATDSNSNQMSNLVATGS